MSPRQSKQNQRNSAKSPEAIESALAAQRAQLIGDVEALSARLAPQALTSMARLRHSAAVGSRLSRLIDDARDGDPASLAIVTGTIVVLAGCSVVAVVKAVRR